MSANKTDSNSPESTNSLATTTPDILLTMIQKVVSDSISNITGENGALHQVKNEIVNHLDNKLEHFENQIAELQSENSTLKSKLISQKSEVDELRDESVILESQIKKALIHANNNEQYSQKTCIRIIGLCPIDSVVIQRQHAHLLSLAKDVKLGFIPFPPAISLPETE